MNNDFSAITVSGRVHEEQVLVNDGDGDVGERCIVKPVDEKIRHQMYAVCTDCEYPLQDRSVL